MLVQPFSNDYLPHELAKDLSILRRTVHFAEDVQDALQSSSTEIAAKIHKLAGPPYEEEGPNLLNVDRRRRKPGKRLKASIVTEAPDFEHSHKNAKNVDKPFTRYLRRKLKRNQLKLKIIRELEKLHEEELGEEQGNLQERIFNNLQSMILGDSYNSGSSGSFLQKLQGDQSLSRIDFIHELTKWFRRSIWFLAFTAAYTLSPTILIITILLGIGFELALNVDVAKQYMDNFMHEFSQKSQLGLEDPLSALKNTLFPREEEEDEFLNYYYY